MEEHSKKVFQGVFTALVTPFKNEQIDFKSLEKLIDYQLNGNICGLVLLGTTGETATLTDEERTQLLSFAIKHVNGRIPVFVGTGSNSTKKAIQYTREAEELGADGMFIVAPYYNRPTPLGVQLHYEKVAKATTKPIFLYSIPTRCGIEIEVQTIVNLRKQFKHIVGIKEAGGSCNRVSEIVKALDDDFCVLSGDDLLTLPFLALNARGVVGVANNLTLKPVVEMVHYALSNDLEKAANINRIFYPFFRTLAIETNPAPIKYCLYRAGLIESPEVRLPLSPLLPENVHLLDTILKDLEGTY